MLPFFRRPSTIYVLLTGLLLGSSLVMSRFGLGQFEAMTFVALRLLGGSIVFLIAYFVFRVRAWPRDPVLWGKAAVFGLIGSALTMTGFTNALKYQSSGVTSLLTTLGPVITAIMAHLFLKDDTFTRRKVIGAFLAFAGAGLLLVRGESGLAQFARADWRGYAWTILGVASNAAGLVYARRFLQGFDSFQVTSIRIFTGAVIILAVVAPGQGFDFSRVQPSGMLAVAYVSVMATFFAFLLYFQMVQKFGATVAAQTENVVPMVATLLGVLFLHEQFTLTMGTGMGLILAGLWVFDQNPA
jgi:drug/metabolite transporter (DMT)-like permease